MAVIHNMPRTPEGTGESHASKPVGILYTAPFFTAATSLSCSSDITSSAVKSGWPFAMLLVGMIITSGFMAISCSYDMSVQESPSRESPAFLPPAEVTIDA